MRILAQRLVVIGIGGVLALSFLFLDAAKYDTADRLWLVLIIGATTPLIPLFLGIQGLLKNTTLSFIAILWLAFLWISFFFSQTQNYGFSEVLIMSSGAVLMLCSTNLGATEWKLIRKIILGSAIFAALYGFWYFPTHGEARMAGLFLDAVDPRNFFPNAFAQFLLMTWPLVFFPGDIQKKWLKVALASILFTALYLTYSRGAWAAFLLQLGIAIFYHRKIIARRLLAACSLWSLKTMLALVPEDHTSHAKKTAIMVLSISLITIILSASLISLRSLNFSTISAKEKITFQNAESATSLGERKDFWIGALQLMIQRPLTGFGPMSFRYAYPQIQKNFLAISDHPHNWILKTAAESGLPAAILLTLMLLIILVRGYKATKENPSGFIVCLAILGSLAHNMVDFNLNFIPTLLVFFLLCGHIISLHHKKNTISIRSSIVIIMGGLILLLIGWTSIKEQLTTFSLRRNPTQPALYAKSFMPRDFFLKEAQKLSNMAMYQDKLLNIHLSKNPLDARAHSLQGNYKKALELDPMNHFSYYRLTMSKLGVGLNDKQWHVLMDLLAKYDRLLEQNIHYTAFSDNPEEAAKIYELMDMPEKAKQIRKTAADIRQSFAASHDFQKQLAPRTLWDFIH
ncbi:MAG: O-antigen ligase family protein [Patescibacteria group bacterium]